jgi:hypothetical protein
VASLRACHVCYNVGTGTKDSRFGIRGPTVSARLRSQVYAAILGAVLCLVAVDPIAAFQAELSRYYEATRDICRTGVTPAITSAYEQARLALDRARPTGGLQDGNFAGLKSPAEMWLDCFQSPGDGKT